MVIQDVIQRILQIFDLDCSEYRVLLILCVIVILILGCVVPFLFRGNSSDSNSYWDGSEELVGSVRAQEKWESPEWQSEIRRSCRPGREGGLVVLVTGAAGFIGLHVCLALKERGDGVIGLDNLNNLWDLSLKRERAEILEKHSVLVIRGDVNDAMLLTRLFSVARISHVVHLAAQPSMRNASEDPGGYVRNNIAGLVTLLDACQRANPRPAFVWTSSTSVYGLNTIVPSLESDRSDQPASLYAASKKAGEGLVYVYNHTHGLSITTLRLGTVYGPWGRSDMAYWIFVRDILCGKEITIYEGSNQGDLLRDWTFVDDIVQGCLAAVDTAEKSRGGGDAAKRRSRPTRVRTFNLGSKSPVTVQSLLEILQEHLNKKAKIRVLQLPPSSITPSMYADIGLARLQLGYNATTTPHAGLKKFVDWYLEYHGISDLRCP